MAKDLAYEVPPALQPGAREELDAFIETLHRTGTLRLCNDFIARLPDVAEVGLDQLNSSTGRNILGTLLLLGDCLGKIDAEKLKPVVTGLQQGIAQAHRAVEGDPPKTRHILALLLRDEDTRRALGAALEIAKSIGAELKRVPTEPSR